MKEEKDIRTLCANCAADMVKAGYKLIWTGNQYRDRCSKCDRMGNDYVVEKKEK